MKLSKRWIPSIVVPSVIAAGVIAIPMQANAVDLPDLSAQEVMSLMDKEIKGFSGTISQVSNLGLPALELSSMMTPEMAKEMEDKIPKGFEDFVPSIIESNALTQGLELVAGNHKLRVFASEAGMRVQILDTMSQRDLILNQNELWIYDAKNATAYSAKFDSSELENALGQVSDADIAKAKAEATAKLEEYAASIQLDLSNPDAVANYLMDLVGKDTLLTVGKDHSVAGRDAYQLIATPKSSNSLIDSIVLSIDAETGMALDVKLFSTEQSEPAFSMGFDSISFATPDESLFNFTAPEGTTVEQLAIPQEIKALAPNDLDSKLQALKGSDPEALKAQLESELAGEIMPDLIGAGWDSVLHLTKLPEGVSLDLLENQILSDMFVTVEGGKAFSTPVMNVLIMDSGEIYAGAVTLEYLESLATK